MAVQPRIATSARVPTISADTELTTLIDYLAGTNPIYIGRAEVGSDTAVAVWQIRKLAYDGSNNLLSIKFANGDSLFDNIWDSRTGYTYS